VAAGQKGLEQLEVEMKTSRGEKALLEEENRKLREENERLKSQSQQLTGQVQTFDRAMLKAKSCYRRPETRAGKEFAMLRGMPDRAERHGYPIRCARNSDTGSKQSCHRVKKGERRIRRYPGKE
jgi:predicted nuclease with TOPRIM domain